MMAAGKYIMWLRVPRLGQWPGFLLCVRGLGSLVTVSDAVVIVVSKEVPMGQQVSVGRQSGQGLLWEWGHLIPL